jgi:lysine N6-hydroxylase
MVNAGRYSHGIAEPQLSLMAWRAARVVNALLGRRVYQAEDGPGLIDWHRATAARAVA